MKVIPFLLSFVVSSICCVSQSWPESLMLVPERTGFEKTSTHADVVAFLDTIASMSDHVRLISMGTSAEGREIPVAVMAKPPVSSPEEARASGKSVVYIQGNIHGGEVEGKEALLMVMRDILLGDKRYLLDHQILLFAPIYNTDGNDKMATGTRPSQENSPLEAGSRRSSEDFDLNRDGVKMEAVETHGLITNIIVPWDPQLFVDLHTTNGTWHAYPLTWAPSYHSSGQKETYAYTKNVMLAAITATAREKYGLNFGPYGDYSLRQGWPVRNFYTYNHHPRYLVNQFGLRNRMAILSEAFAHERFYQRIHSTYHFVTEILEYTHRHIDEITNINREAETAAIDAVLKGAGQIKKGVRFRMAPSEVINNFPTYEYIPFRMSDGTDRLVRTGKIVHLDSVVYHAAFTPTVESTLPRGYVIPAEFNEVVQVLRDHGVKIDVLSAATSFRGEVFTVSAYETAENPFEHHFMARAEGSFSPATKKFRKGDYIVDLAQPLANFIFYLLEPQSDDGIVAWNFLDSYFDHSTNRKHAEYPIFKYFEKK